MKVMHSLTFQHEGMHEFLAFAENLRIILDSCAPKLRLCDSWTESFP
jgi:hypothetical protein